MRCFLASPRRQMVDVDGFGDDRTDRHPRIERAIRILEDDLHPAAHLAQRVGLERAEIDAVEADRARGGIAQADHRPARRALATTGFTDESERLALADLEGDAVDGLTVPTSFWKIPGRIGK